MRASNPDYPIQSESSGFDSRDTEILIIDGLGDNTTRPARPLLLRLAQAERDRIARWQHLSNQPPASGKPADSSEGSANSGT